VDAAASGADDARVGKPVFKWLLWTRSSEPLTTTLRVDLRQWRPVSRPEDAPCQHGGVFQGEPEGHFAGKRPARRPKSCGPDARRWHQGTESLLPDRAQDTSSVPTVTNQAIRHRGEHEASRKPTARGTPDVSGAFVVANSCACFYRAWGCGRIARPAFRAPSVSRAGILVRERGKPRPRGRPAPPRRQEQGRWRAP